MDYQMQKLLIGKFILLKEIGNLHLIIFMNVIIVNLLILNIVQFMILNMLLHMELEIIQVRLLKNS